MKQFRIATLLSIVTFFAILFVIYPVCWHVSKIASFTITTLLFVAVGIVHAKGHSHDHLLGAAVVAGIIGANFAMILHFSLSFTSATPFNSRGYSFLDTVLMFAPVSTLTGAAVGASVFWFSVRAHRWARDVSRLLIAPDVPVRYPATVPDR